MTFRTNQIVWAKLASYPHWPSKVVKWSACPGEITDKLGDAEEDNELIFFYGSHNYAWIHRSLIVDWDEGFQEYINNKKAPKSFQQALKEVEKEKEKRERRAREGKENPEEDSESDKSANSGSGDDDKNKKSDSTEKKKPKKPKSESKDGRENGKKHKKRDLSPDSSESEDEPRKDKPKHSNGDTTDKEKQNSTNKGKDSDEKKDAPFSKKRKIMELVEEREERARQEKTQNDTPVKSESPPHTQIPTTPLSSKKPEDRKKLNNAAFQRAIQTVAKHPISKYLKFEIVHHGDGVAQTKATFSDLRSSIYELHANNGAVDYLLDLTCFLATLTQLNEGDSALTQDFHATSIYTIPPGSEVLLKAKVVCTKENLVFIDGEAWLSGKLCVTARVIKAIHDANYALLAKEGMNPTTPQPSKTSQQQIPKQSSPVSPPQ